MAAGALVVPGEEAPFASEHVSLVCRLKTARVPLIELGGINDTPFFPFPPRVPRRVFLTPG